MRQIEKVAVRVPGRGIAWFDDGCFGFSVVDENDRLLRDDQGNLSEAGSEREFGSIGQLIAASKPWIDWNATRNVWAASGLAKAQLESWDSETRSVLNRLVVV